MAVVNIENVTLLTTSADAALELRTLLGSIANIENLKVIVASDKQLRDAIARIIWPDKPAKAKP